MSRSLRRPAKPASGRDVLSAWLIVAALVSALALVSLVDTAITERLNAIAQLR